MKKQNKTTTKHDNIIWWKTDLHILMAEQNSRPATQFWNYVSGYFDTLN